MNAQQTTSYSRTTTATLDGWAATTTATAVRPAVRPASRRTESLIVGTCIANDVIRHGIEAVLLHLPSIRTVHHCTSAEDIPAAAAVEHFDVLITTDPAVAAAASGTAGPMRILLLLDDADAEDIVFEMPTADGFLLQHELTADRLSHALTEVCSGELVMPSSLARRLLVRRAAPGTVPTAGRSRLTDRQLAALRLMADGMSNKQIARRLQISEHGAKRLVTSIMVKLDAPNRTTAVLAAMRWGVIPAPGSRQGELTRAL